MLKNGPAKKVTIFINQLMHTLKVEVLAQHLPIRIEFVETAQKIDEVLSTLYEVVKLARKSIRPEPAFPHERKQCPGKLLRVFMGEADKWHDAPLFDAIVKMLRMMDIEGAMVYQGILGYGAKGHEHKATFFHPTRRSSHHAAGDRYRRKDLGLGGSDRRHARRCLIVISDVEIVRLVRGSKAAEVSDATKLSS